MNGNMKEILSKIGKSPLNIIDLGCGDGKKAVIFIEHLKGKVRLKYFPIDISGYMVDKALERIRKLDAGEVVQLQWNISDFENLPNIASLLKMSGFKKNLILLLGNTLGNFEIHELLYQVRNSMSDGDFLLIGNGLDTRHPDEILKSYNTPEVNDFMMHIPTQIGLEKDDLIFGTRFRNSRVEIYYTINKDKKVEFQNKVVNFNRGDQILVSISYKYDKHDFMSYLKMYFGDVEIFVSKDNSYSLILCKK